MRHVKLLRVALTLVALLTIDVQERKAPIPTPLRLQQPRIIVV